MAVALSPLAKQQFIDQDGHPYFLGKLFTYAATTTTPLATFIDSTGGTPNTNPIILDPAGRCNLWLTVGTGYKLELFDVNNVLVWSVDNILVPASPSAAQLLPIGCTVLTTSFTFNASNNAAVLTWAGGLPAQTIILGVTGDPGATPATGGVLQTFGNGNGLTGLSIGDPGQTDRFAANLALSSGTRIAMKYAGMPVFPTATDMVVTALDGFFASTGQLKVTLYTMALA